MSNEIKGLRSVPVTEKRQLFQHYQDSALRRKHKPPYSDLRLPELNQIGNIRQIQLWPNSYVPEDANFGCAELVFGFFKHKPWMRSLFFLGSPVNLFVDPINFLGERGYAVVEGNPMMETLLHMEELAKQQQLRSL